MNTSKKVRFLALGALIAALYAVLTYVAAAVNLAYGPVQFRFSEALTVPLGCVIANLGSPLGVVDWVFGPLATLLAALATYLVRDVKVKGLPILAPLPPVITNVVIVGFELACLSDAGTFGLGNFTWAAFGTSALSVGIGELVVCYVLGLPLILALERTKAVSRLAV